MRNPGYPRWAVSFADLTLVLLGFSVMLHVVTARGVGASRAVEAAPKAAQASGILFQSPAAPLFEEGEARLTAPAHAELVKLGHAALARGRALQVESIGSAGSGARFDRWELAAARAAAVARVLAEGGLPQERIDLVIPSAAVGAAGEQRILVRRS